jgi:acetoin utilization deacetylase AcuC-like enzyme
MFIYNKDTQLNLIEYGIEIPLLGKRGRLVYEFIKNNFTEDKIIQYELNNCEKENLLLAHSEIFINRLLSNPVDDLLKTFELVNQDGSFNRYNPNIATKSLDILTQKILKQVSGTILTCEEAIKNNYAFHIGGGLHHAMTDTGRGFCLVNDIVIAARFMQKHHGLKNILIIDVDAHKGDGTAQITENDNTLTTLSIHMKNGWPLDSGDKESAWNIASNIDIPVLKTDDYISKLNDGLDKLMDYPSFDLCIVVQGSDPYEHDELESSGELNLSLDKMLERDKLVYNFLSSKNIPQAYVMSGGYGTKAHEPYIEFLKYLKGINF